jgi:3-oxoacyl-[acyl-carrier-protein] synthase II
MNRRVVVTGVGLASPIGIGAEAFWREWNAGTSGLGPIRQFDAGGFRCRIAGEVPPFKIAEFLPASYRKAAKLMVRDTHLAAIAAHQAFESAGLKSRATDAALADGDRRFNCHVGTGLISIDLDEVTASMVASQGENQLDLKLWGAGGMEQLTPLWLLKYLPNMVASHLTIIHGLTGASNTITAGEASGHLAIGEAFRAIQRGDADRALCGGAESKINPLSVARQSLLNRLNDQANDSPSTAVRPFAEAAQGSVLGEGAAMLILEELDLARQRGAAIYAELCGFGVSQEPYRPRQTACTFPSYRNALRAALREADVNPSAVSVLAPCGLGCVAEDRAERIELEAVFEGWLSDLPLLLLKPQVGNLSAGNSLEAAAAVLTLSRQVVPPHARIGRLAASSSWHEPHDPAATPLETAVCSTHSLMGQNAALVFRRYAAS